MGPEDHLIADDPDSEESYDALAERVRVELQARTAFGDDPMTPTGQQRLAEMIADVILDEFTIRPRTARRYRRGPSSATES